MSFINDRFINDRATREAVGHTDVIKLARAMLNDKDPAVRKAAAAHLATSTSDEVRKMVGALSTTKPNSRAEAPPSFDGPRRADRAAKLASTRQGAKALSAVAGGVRQAWPGNPSRFAHLAAACDAGAAELAVLPQHPACGSPEQAAAFIMIVLKKDDAALRERNWSHSGMTKPLQALQSLLRNRRSAAAKAPSRPFSTKS